MSDWLIVFVIIAVFAVIIITVSLFIKQFFKYFSGVLYQKIKAILPKIVIYRPDKKDKS